MLFHYLKALHSARFCSRNVQTLFICPNGLMYYLCPLGRIPYQALHKKKGLMHIEMAAWTHLTRKCMYVTAVASGLNQQRPILSVFRNLMSIYSITHLDAWAFFQQLLKGSAFIMGCGAAYSSCSKPQANFLVDRLLEIWRVARCMRKFLSVVRRQRF